MKNKIYQQDLNYGREVLAQEIAGLKALSASLDDNFSKAVELIYKTTGRVILSGMGKSGHVANKIAATFASTGTPAFFVHPGEASHGDLGMITKDDVIILLSNSGETSELKDIIYYARRFSISLIGIVRRRTSALVDAADIALVLPETAEAAPVSAPTTSTTMMMALGDAIAVSLMHRRGFKPDDFKVFHPGGKIGQSFIKVSDLMKKGKDLPITTDSSSISDAVEVMTKKGLGSVVILDKNKKVAGVITDGDLRRHLKQISKIKSTSKAKDVMSVNPYNIRANALAAEAISIMNAKKVTSLIIKSKAGELEGIIHIHDILKAGIS